MPTSVSKPPGYSHSDAFDSGFLSVGTIHKLWYAQHGAPAGRPVLFLHGGPGGGTSIANTAFFDPRTYRVVLLDQRGGGQSTPAADIRENTTQDLVEDIERLREHLGIAQWAMVFGGSWGSTLALAYAQTYPQATVSLVLRGVFTVRETELANTYASYGVSSQLFPDAYDDFVSHLRSNSTKDADSLADVHTVLSEYYRLLRHDDLDIRLAAARVWNKYEGRMSFLIPDEEIMQKIEDDDKWNLQHALIECHYFLHGAWLQDEPLLSPSRLDRIKHIRCTVYPNNTRYIVQGRYDIMCPATTAWELHKGLPDAKLYLIPDAGHSANEAGTKAKLIEICDEISKAGSDTL